METYNKQEKVNIIAMYVLLVMIGIQEWEYAKADSFVKDLLARVPLDVLAVQFDIENSITPGN